MRWLVLFLSAACALAQSQNGFPLESVKITGNESIPADRIIAASGLKIGQAAERPQFNEARDRLLATGAFTSVGFKYGPSAKSTGIDATFQVIETQPLYPYHFEELPASESTLREMLGKQEVLFADKIPPTPQVMNRYSSEIARYLNDNGAPGLQVIGEVGRDANLEPVILFRPIGERKSISEVNFKGNTVLSNPELWHAVNQTAIGTPYSELLFQQVLDGTIRATYEEKGYVRVAFPKVETARSPDNDGVVVTVTVDEGQPYTLGDVTIEGVDRAQARALYNLGGWKKGDTFNLADINAGIGKIRKSFREDGYLRVAATTTRDIDDSKRAVDLAITIQPGPLFTMGKLNIVGLDIISEPVIRKLWHLDAGQPYRESYPDVFLKMIKDDDYFDNLARTGAEADLHEDNSVDVTLTFLGAKAAADFDKRGR
jgi:outer membrane protein insertion porin family